MAPRVSSWALLALAAVVGASFRLFHFFLARSLWLDESMLALNIARRSASDLLQPLDYNQVAPVLFLLVERAIIVVTGVSETSLRAFPMLAGLALPVLLFVLGRRLLGEAAGVAAAVLAALSPTLVRYANEVKPYGTDALATALLLWAALRYERGHSAEGRGSQHDLMLLGLVGVLAVLLSFPALFVAAGMALSLALLPGVRVRQLSGLAVCGLLWLGAALTPYFLIYHATAASPAQQDGYAFGFLTPGAGLGARALYALRGSVWPTFWGDGANIPQAPDASLFAVVAAVGLGLAAVVRRRGVWAGSLLAAPLLIALLASALRRYPLGVPRLMVFSAPLLILLASALVADLYERLRSRARATPIVVLAALLLTPLLQQRVQQARDPYLGEDARSLVAAYRELRRGELEPVYIAARGLASWLFYVTNWESPDYERLDFYARAASSGPAFENLPPRGRPVVDEGWDLVYRRRLKAEIIGIGTGRQWKWPSYSRPSVDEGWAANEARRIEAEAVKVPDYPCAWLYFTRMSERSYKPLTWELRDHHGAWLSELQTAPGGLVACWCFYEKPAAKPRQPAGAEDREPEAETPGAAAPTPSE